MQRFFIITALVAFLGLALAACKFSAPQQQQEFKSPADAVQAFETALKTDNDKELLAILGPDANELIYTDNETVDRQRRETFLKDYEEKHSLVPKGDKFLLVIGQNDWSFPIPLMKKGDHWIFDIAAGKEEIIDRRIGRDELNAIQVLLAIVDAEREYAMVDRNNDSLLEYTPKFRSEPGKKDGLYWEAKEEEESSPLGELVANARAEGYAAGGSQNPEPYHGYFYRILTAQGENAPGGAYDYIVNGKMIGGFALVAYPAEYGDSGIMTFIVNHEGVVYQKDLGENTGELAKAMTLYDPDETWMVVQ